MKTFPKGIAPFKKQFYLPSSISSLPCLPSQAYFELCILGTVTCWCSRFQALTVSFPEYSQCEPLSTPRLLLCMRSSRRQVQAEMVAG